MLITQDEKPVKSVPLRVFILFLLGLMLQAAWHISRQGPEASARQLPAPPTSHALRLASLDDPVMFSRLLMLWLQAFDNQPGISIPFSELDYAVVRDWLQRMLQLDPSSHYPLLAASRVYTLVPDREKQQLMLEFVYQQFLLDPNARWRWLAHAAIMAKHQLQDMPLALKYANAITEHATGPDVPFWARDIGITILEDMGELEAARILIGGLLDDESLTDPNEIRFLSNKLEELENKANQVE